MKTKNLVRAAMLVALGVALSNFIYFPVGASKCTPVQHIINVIAGITLGPSYAVVIAFLISAIRNIIGTGTLLAFPGSMIGAFLAGLLYKKTKNKIFAAAGEIVGTGIIGAIVAYPIAKFIIGKEATVLFFVLPFLINTVVGSIIALFILKGAKIVTDKYKK